MWTLGPTPKACAKCGTPCASTKEAWRHCQRPRAIAARCRHCEREHATTRAAYHCCMQRGLQRTPGYAWRGYESIERRYQRVAGEIRADAAEMERIRALAVWLCEQIPE